MLLVETQNSVRFSCFMGQHQKGAFLITSADAWWFYKVIYPAELIANDLVTLALKIQS